MNIAIIVNSCLTFYEKTIPIFIESAKKANIPPQNIYIVVGECENESTIECREDYNIAFCKYVNIDYNGVIYFSQTEYGLNELQKYTHFFYLHDTCEITENFWENIHKYHACNSYTKLLNNCTKNIGLFQVKWFIENKKEMLNYFINYDVNLRMNYKNGDFVNTNVIKQKFQGLPEILNEDSLFIVNQGELFSNNNVDTFFAQLYSEDYRYGTIYKDPGIIKYQKNYAGPDPPGGRKNNGTWDLTL
jgi:hypothetical protein